MAVSTPPAQATNAELARWAFEALNRGDIDALRQFWTDETVERFPTETRKGADDIAAYFRDALAAIEGFHMEIVAIAETGDDVFVHWKLTGRHTGALEGIQPTGKSLEIDGIDHFVFRDGKVVSNFVVFDQTQYGRQLGMMPPDGSPADKAMKAAFNARTKLAARFRR
jgi:steroid delta-isomerase-like uncharacterized protein